MFETAFLDKQFESILLFEVLEPSLGAVHKLHLQFLLFTPYNTADIKYCKYRFLGQNT